MSWNPISDAEGYIARQELEMESWPECEYCGTKVNEYYELPNGEIVCEDCISRWRREYEPPEDDMY
jgi:formylmethanofuran dehydrogenase subunit E